MQSGLTRNNNFHVFSLDDVLDNNIKADTFCKPMLIFFKSSERTEYQRQATRVQ